MTDTLKHIQKALMGFSKRAEKASEELLVATFVDSEPMLDLISTTNNQVIYGRRGTGKTHALRYLAEDVHKSGDVPVYMDLRFIGSNNSIYGDGSRTLSERASTLLVDVVNAVHAELENIAIDQVDYHPRPKELTGLVDELKRSVTTMRISGATTVEDGKSQNEEKKRAIKVGGKADEAEAALEFSSGRTVVVSDKTTRTGAEILHLDFGNIASSCKALIDRLNVDRIWLLLDEWSEVPYDLQPYLSDLLRRTFIPLNKVTVKIAAIEHRSVFNIMKDNGEYVGLELGADIFADLNLDNFLVFDNEQDKATQFFKTLIYRHFDSAEGSKGVVADADELVSELFTQSTAFEEFVRAVEGVPRDALNLASAAAKAFGQKISVNHVRSAARDWYQQDKAAVTRNTPSLSVVLSFLVDEVIGNRRARAFLFESGEKYEFIERLFDARLLHILKRNISSHDAPGVRYDVYKIDYGCYVDLINTTKAPNVLFEADEGENVDVPRDDYRSIRRAILKKDDLELALSRSVG